MGGGKKSSTPCRPGKHVLGSKACPCCGSPERKSAPPEKSRLRLGLRYSCRASKGRSATPRESFVPGLLLCLGLNKRKAAMLRLRALSVVCCPCLLNPAGARMVNTGLQGKALERWPELAQMRWPGTPVLFVFYVCAVASLLHPGLPPRGRRKIFCPGKFQGSEA